EHGQSCLKQKEPVARPAHFPSKMWLRGRDLNPRPLGYEPREMTRPRGPHRSIFPLIRRNCGPTLVFQRPFVSPNVSPNRSLTPRHPSWDINRREPSCNSSTTESQSRLNQLGGIDRSPRLITFSSSPPSPIFDPTPGFTWPANVQNPILLACE